MNAQGSAIQLGEMKFSMLPARVALAVVGAAILAAIGCTAVSWQPPSPISIAVATSLTGLSGAAGAESLLATKLYVDEVNRSGGVNGHPIELVLFDDTSNPEVGRANAQTIADSPCVAVLGHFLSTVSLAAGPDYKAAGIPALTGTSSVDALTVDNPYYFRAQTPVSVQGRSTAEYLRHVFKTPVVYVLFSRDSFGQSFLQGFSEAYDTDRLVARGFDVGPDASGDSVRETVDAVADGPEPGIIVIGTDVNSAPEVLKATRRRGIKAPVMALAGAGTEGFLRNLATEPEEKEHPGFFSNDLYAATPVIFDGLGAAAQAFAAEYARVSGGSPGWVGARAYDTVRLMVEALRRAGIQNRPETKQTDRERIRAELAKIDNPRAAITGLTGRLYFDSNRNMPRPFRVGFFRRGRFITAPLQLVPAENLESADIKEEVEKGHIVSFGNRHYWLQRVVYTGIDINRVNRIDVKQGTFNIDFYLWMRFAGEDGAPVHVEFPALLDRGAFDPARPLRTKQEKDLSYQLYRIAGDFKASYDLHDYPFDAQQLLLRFQNMEQQRERITYVIDSVGLRLTGETDAIADDENPYAGLQLWRFVRLRYFVDAFATGSTLGQPSLSNSRVKTEFAAFNATVVLRRDFAIFIVKTLVPLFLLVLVVFATLFFPETLFRERINTPVTAILTSAVLLLTVSNQLGDVGYTVAIEKIFYAFFGLCLMTMLSGYGHEQLRQRGTGRLATILDHAAKVLYVGIVCAVIVFFYRRYGLPQ
jgi:branched-chain amino acid transport system substrate-binding protein